MSASNGSGTVTPDSMWSVYPIATVTPQVSAFGEMIERELVGRRQGGASGEPPPSC